MLFSTPPLTPDDQAVLAAIAQKQDDVRHHVAETYRWYGLLRRGVFARAIRGSNSIEGYEVSKEDAYAAVAGEEPLGPDDEAWAAVQGYRDAMTYLLQLTRDDPDPQPPVVIDARLLSALHFMMTKHDLSKRPGRFRKGDIFVQQEDTGEIVYQGPPPERVEPLMGELLATLADGLRDDEHVLVQAAMAHLNLVMIHPYKDGNGRMARVLQSLVLIRGRVAAAPEFCSIEEYLGANTDRYYEVLADVGAGAWHPERDATPWVRFCLVAHYRQVLTIMWRARELQRFWTVAEREVERAGLSERCVAPVAFSMSGFAVRNSSYRELAEVTEQTASRELKQLVALGLFEPRGGGRGRHYVPVERLREEHTTIRRDVRGDARRESDPYLLVRDDRDSTD